jgi:uncharacterized protein (DUF952 family)
MNASPDLPISIYKLMSADEWKAAAATGLYEGSAVDQRDGFIHFSTAEQVKETAARHFADIENLMLIVVDVDRLDGELQWEPSRGGALFPHLYGTFRVEAVIEVEPVARGRDGSFVFPSLDGV